mgnify:CR=1 FL=1
MSTPLLFSVLELTLYLIKGDTAIPHRPYDNKDMMDVDASIATDHMMMAAHNLGLGTCWMTYFDPAGLKEEFNIPDNLEAINILEIGYADGEAKSPDRHKDMRKNPDEMVFYNKF